MNHPNEFAIKRKLVRIVGNVQTTILCLFDNHETMEQKTLPFACSHCRHCLQNSLEMISRIHFKSDSMIELPSWIIDGYCLACRDKNTEKWPTILNGRQMNVRFVDFRRNVHICMNAKQNWSKKRWMQVHEKLSVKSNCIDGTSWYSGVYTDESWFWVRQVLVRFYLPWTKQTKRHVNGKGKMNTLIHRCNVIFIMKNPNNVSERVIFVLRRSFCVLSFISGPSNINSNRIFHYICKETSLLSFVLHFVGHHFMFIHVRRHVSNQFCYFIPYKSVKCMYLGGIVSKCAASIW